MDKIGKYGCKYSGNCCYTLECNRESSKCLVAKGLDRLLGVEDEKLKDRQN